MAETGSNEMHLRLPSLPSLELGDLSSQDLMSLGTDASTGLGLEPEDIVPTQQGAELGRSSATTTEGHGPPKPALTGEAQSRSHIPPPIAIPPSAVTRNDSEAIGAPTDLPTPMLKSPTSAMDNGPVIQFTLLLASSGTRHPYQINEKYLAKRNINALGEDEQFDPSVISVYTLKELILKDWRDGRSIFCRGCDAVNDHSTDELC